ncbi:hypothetical protein [Bacillus thuringiensis]|nr:hypothetical protein [Bacillus thuringiensis]
MLFRVRLDLEAATCIVDRIDGFIFQLMLLAMLEEGADFTGD